MQVSPRPTSLRELSLASNVAYATYILPLRSLSRLGEAHRSATACRDLEMSLAYPHSNSLSSTSERRGLNRCQLSVHEAAGEARKCKITSETLERSGTWLRSNSVHQHECLAALPRTRAAAGCECMSVRTADARQILDSGISYSYHPINKQSFHEQSAPIMSATNQAKPSDTWPSNSDTLTPSHQPCVPSHRPLSQHQQPRLPSQDPP